MRRAVSGVCSGDFVVKAAAPAMGAASSPTLLDEAREIRQQAILAHGRTPCGHQR